MPYLPEEAAMLDGLIGSYLVSPRLSESIRRKYAILHQHFQEERLTAIDYQCIEAAIPLFLPMLKRSPPEYKLMAGMLAKTKALVAGVQIG